MNDKLYGFTEMLTALVEKYYETQQTKEVIGEAEEVLYRQHRDLVISKNKVKELLQEHDIFDPVAIKIDYQTYLIDTTRDSKIVTPINTW